MKTAHVNDIEIELVGQQGRVNAPVDQKGSRTASKGAN
ncbi:MAG: hypothetical protein QOC66_2591 [Pseudonocardiales bacterium]|nr:hypothetical protein [Pseudonocardiales bacterium]